MNLSNLKPAEGSIKNRKRIGRGQGSGRGGTSTKGHKGAQSRTGYSRKIGFEGGQMPLQRRIPKGGFKNINRVEYKAINLDIIENLASVKGILDITPEVMRQNGLLSNNELVKVLGRGDLKAKVNITANGFSTTAIAAIEALGGTCTKI